MNVIARLGGFFVGRLSDLQHWLAVGATVVVLALNPAHWPRTVRNVLARQILFTGFEAIGLMAGIAFVVGITIVLQAQLWFEKLGQKELLGPLLIVFILRETAPTLASLVIIIRSASAMATEMANMKLSGEVRLLESQGLDPLVYLVMPRVIGAGICGLGLALVFVIVSLLSGFLFGTITGVRMRPDVFMNMIFGSLSTTDALNLLSKSILSAATTATICCVQGLSVSTDSAEIPRATSQALQRCLIAMFVIAAIVSLLTYL
jgi:phospholipid/cholesterol/gamma-HCH transport system permease protein